MDHFEIDEIQAGEARILVRWSGSGPPLLLLHGFPQTHAPYAKRAMAHDMVIVMERLGFRRFSVAGHDRGGRVAYRMALDHPERVDRLAVLDVLPTGTVWDRADAAFALAYFFAVHTPKAALG